MKSKKKNKMIKGEKSKGVFTIGVDTFLRFGKHKDRTIRQILIEDPSYVRWMYEQPGFNLSKDVLQALIEARHAPNLNSIKERGHQEPQIIQSEGPFKINVYMKEKRILTSLNPVKNIKRPDIKK